MIWVKKYEDWEWNPLPLTSKDFLNDYRECLSCGKLDKVFKPKSPLCRYCGSKDLRLMNETEFYTKLESQVDDEEEWKNIITQRNSDRDTFVRLDSESPKN